MVGVPTHGVASGGRELASVQSAPLREIAARVLEVSDNEGAEVLSHQVGKAVSGSGTFADGAAAVTQTLEGLGVTADFDIHDGSGLSRENRITPLALVQVLRLALDPAHPELNAVATALPVAGFTGSLTNRFDQPFPDSRGLVRAKTGTLSNVSSLAGIAVDQDGHEMLFALMADRIAQAQRDQGPATRSTRRPVRWARAIVARYQTRLLWSTKMRGMTVDTLPLPTYGDATVVVPAPDSGPGNWSGAASAVLVDGTFWLTYRVRRPLTEGRGVAVVVARSDDGVHFDAGHRGRPRDVRLRVVRASRARPGARPGLAALPLLRDVRLQALVGRLAHRAHGRGAACRPPAGRAARATSGSRSRTRSSSTRPAPARSG